MHTCASAALPDPQHSSNTGKKDFVDLSLTSRGENVTQSVFFYMYA